MYKIIISFICFIFISSVYAGEDGWMDSLDVSYMNIGGGYGRQGCTIASNGNITTNGTISADGGIADGGSGVYDDLTIGGGYGSTGTTIGSQGDISTNGNQIIEGTTTMSGDVHMNDNKYVTFGNVLATPDSSVGWNTTQTVDGLYLSTATGQNTLIVGEEGDKAYDFAHGAQTNPTVFIQSAAQSATQYISLTHNQTNGLISTGTGSLVLNTNGFSMGDATHDAGTFTMFTGTGSVTYSTYFFDYDGDASLNDIKTINSSGFIELSSPLGIVLTGDAGVVGDFTDTLGASEIVSINASTTPHIASTVIDTSCAVNSASVSVMNETITVGTALSAGEVVDGQLININGLAGDTATSSMNGIRLTSTNATGGTNTGLNIQGFWDSGITNNSTTNLFGNVNLGDADHNAGTLTIMNGVTATESTATITMLDEDVDSDLDDLKITSDGTIGFNAVEGSYFGTISSQILSINQTTGIVGNEHSNSEYDFRYESDNSANAFFIDAGADTIGFFMAAPTAQVDMDGRDLTGQTTEQSLFRVNNISFGLASGTTLATKKHIQFLAPTINGIAGGSVETVTDSSTVYIDNAPSGSNLTFSNTPSSLWVDNGTSRLDGGVTFGDGIAITAAAYQIARNNDATNRLQFNVPTGAILEFSINDVAQSALSSAGWFVSSINENVSANNAKIAFNSTGLAINRNVADANTACSITQTNASSTGSVLTIANSAGTTTTFARDGNVTIAPTVSAGGVIPLTITQAAHTAITQNEPSLSIGAASLSLDAGTTIANTSWANISAPTYNGVAGGVAETITSASTLYVSDGPIQGANAAITDSYALLIDAGASRFDGRILGNQGADVASANNLTLGNDGNVFEITGTTEIQLMSNVGWRNGAETTLLFTANPVVKHNTATSGTDITIYLANSMDFAATTGDLVTLVLSEIGGTQAWREKSRTTI